MRLSSVRSSLDQSSEGDNAGKVWERFQGYLTRKDGWTQEKPNRVETAVIEVSGNDQVPAYRGSVEIRNASKADVLLICRFLLGEDRYVRTPERNSFMLTFDFDETLRKKNTTVFSTVGTPVLRGTAITSPKDDGHHQVNTRRPSIMLSPLSLHSRLSSATDTSSAMPSPMPSGTLGGSAKFGNASDSDGEEGHSDEELVTPTAAATSEEKASSLRRRFSKLAASGFRRSTLTTMKSPRSQNQDAPKQRRYRITRHEYPNAIVLVDDDSFVDPFDEDLENVKRIKMHMLGCMIEEVSEGNDDSNSVIKVTIVSDIDPLLEKWETSLLKPEVISDFCGKNLLEGLFHSLMEQIKHLTAEDTTARRDMINLRQDWTGDMSLDGSLRWVPYGSAKDSFVVGSCIKHGSYGRGFVESFDMRGTFRVKYDNTEAPISHQSEEKDRLHVSLSVGFRIRHRRRGFGTVQSTAFDEIIIRYDDGALRKYPKDTWRRKLRRIWTTDHDDTPPLRLCTSPHTEIREGIIRAQFVIPGATTTAVLKSILGKAETISEMEQGEVLERKVVNKIDANTRMIWEHRSMPKPLTSRTFLSTEKWTKVMGSYIVQSQYVCDEEYPEQNGLIRGRKLFEGWVIEPVPMTTSCHVTHLLCLDLAGFVPPEALRSIRDGILISEALDLLYATHVEE